VLIERTLEVLRRSWENPETRYPHTVINAMLLCDKLGLNYPPWLRALAAKFPVKMGRGVAYEVGKVVFRPRRAGSRLGRPSDKAEIRAAAERQLRRGDPRMNREQFAKKLRGDVFPFRDEDDPPAVRTVMDYLSSPLSLWRKYVVEPNKLRSRRRARKNKT
jgi:hypothetical protein